MALGELLFGQFSVAFLGLCYLSPNTVRTKENVNLLGRNWNIKTSIRRIAAHPKVSNA